MSFIENAAKPMGFGGRAMLTAMNLGHKPLAAWGLGFLPKEDFRVIADCGCGGGAAVRALLRKYPTAKVYGVANRNFAQKGPARQIAAPLRTDTVPCSAPMCENCPSKTTGSIL